MRRALNIVAIAVITFFALFCALRPLAARHLARGG
jgi:hypothetical protein